jgi:two-component system sensor histidine kinase MtrB
LLTGRFPRLTAAGRRLWRAGRRRARFLARAVRLAYRRSLHLRMVTITLVVSSLLVGVFGFLVAKGSTDSLLDGAKAEVSADLKDGAGYAASQLKVHTRESQLVRQTINTTLRYLSGSPQPGGAIVVMKSDLTGPLSSPDVDAASAITPQLERQVAVERKVAWQIVTRNLDGKGPVTYLVYGSGVPTGWGGQVELYYLVPLTREATTADQIRTIVLITGAALVVLLGLLAALVTRLVVNPVRVAARTAQRLSAGLLDQRMAVTGEDDLALLAASFNQMAANLQRQIVRLEEMSRLQRRFTSDVSHELRTPLTTIRMAADLIHTERNQYDPVVARSAELLQTELDRFENLLTDLLEISRFDAGFAVLDAEPTDLVPVVHRVADRLASLAERAGVQLLLRVPSAPVIAEVDPRRVERILRNLVGNAVEHGERRPVEVTLVADETAAAVTVRDHGVGLQPGEEKLVFNRFWRADPSRARQTGGTGLGLSISLEDARLHGGWLEAWGAPGDGAQFRLTLPLRDGDRLVSSPLRLVPPHDGDTEDLPRPIAPARRPQLALPAGPLDDDGAAAERTEAAP